MKQKEKVEYEDAEEMETETLIKDQEISRRPSPSDIMPEDYYAYKKFVNLPESQQEFAGVIDKDVVFANLGGSLPDRETLNFQSVTIEWTKQLFTTDIEVWINKKDSSRYAFNKSDIPEDEVDDYLLKLTTIIDPDALPILKVLTNRFKFDVVSSRAKGNTRASMQDIMTHTTISKDLTRKRKETEGKFGLGGN
jgi:hypothetical protein